MRATDETELLEIEIEIDSEALIVELRGYIVELEDMLKANHRAVGEAGLAAARQATLMMASIV